MTWFKVDDHLHAHPKTVQAGNAALGLWVRAGSWSAEQLTNGFIPDNLARQYGKPRDAAALVAAGMWQQVDGGYRFHDWADWQPGDVEVEALRQKRSEAGKKGAAKRWGRPESDDDTDGKPHGNLPSAAITELEPKTDRKGESVGTPPDAPLSGAFPQVSGSTRIASATEINGKPIASAMANQCPDPDPVLGVKGDRSSSDRNARANGDGPDLDKIATELHQPHAWAQRVATDILTRAGLVTNPTAYVLSAVRGEPTRYQPTPGPPPVDRLCIHGRDQLTCIDCLRDGDTP